MQIAFAEKDEVLSARSKEHEGILSEKEKLCEQLIELRKELDLAYKTVAEQVSLSSCYIRT